MGSWNRETVVGGLRDGALGENMKPSLPLSSRTATRCSPWTFSSAMIDAAVWEPSPKMENSMTRSREANRGLEFEFDRFRHDDGRPRQFSAAGAKNRGIALDWRSLAGSDRDPDETSMNVARVTGIEAPRESLNNPMFAVSRGRGGLDVKLDDIADRPGAALVTGHGANGRYPRRSASFPAVPPAAGRLLPCHPVA